MSVKHTILKVLIPILIILLGLGIMAMFIKNRPAPKKEFAQNLGPLVHVLSVKPQNHTVTISATGTVTASKEITVIPRVSGDVVKVSPAFVEGGFFKRGDVLFEVEDTDYLLAIKRAEATVAKAEYDLVSIQSQARVARSEWQRLSKAENISDPNPLVMFKPQLKNAQASIESARSALQQVQLDLERTKIRAPFNARLRSKTIDLGQYVRAGIAVAVLADTERIEIPIAMPLEDLAWFDIPSQGRTTKGAEARVMMSIGNETYHWQGTVVRSYGEVDPRSRMAHVVVAVDDPYGLTSSRNTPRALEPGSFVTIEIVGRTLTDVIIIPRTALRQENTVWVLSEDNTLTIKKITPLRVTRNKVILKAGLDDGGTIVLTTLSGASEGTKLRPIKEDTQ